MKITKKSILGDHDYNQKNYEEIGEIITDLIFGLLQSDPMNLVKIDINDSFAFVSQDFHSNDKLMIFIHGSGVVRAGQWARKLIINNDLNLGTLIPDVLMAKSRGFGILVTNTNDNFRNGKPIKGCENAINAGLTTWQKLIQDSHHQKIAILAHSYGGNVSLKLAENYHQDFQDRVFAVFLTDSAHSSSFSVKKGNWINFVASSKALDEDLGQDKLGICVKSAGHKTHEWTPSTSRDCIFQYLDKLTK